MKVYIIFLIRNIPKSKIAFYGNSEKGILRNLIFSYSIFKIYEGIFMTRDDFEKIFDESLGVSIWSLNSGLKCFICGKPIRMSKIYYVNGVKKNYSNYNFVCTNKINSHKSYYITYSIAYLDMFEGMTKAYEKPCAFGEVAIF
jgi:hypothetical protein